MLMINGSSSSSIWAHRIAVIDKLVEMLTITILGSLRVLNFKEMIMIISKIILDILVVLLVIGEVMIEEVQSNSYWDLQMNEFL